MKAIRLICSETVSELCGRSKWWGAPDLPSDIPYPCVTLKDDADEWEEPLTFICQIRCKDIATLDSEGLLPHGGMLYFFAALDYYLGEDSPLYCPIGEWEKPFSRVIYSPAEDGLEPYLMTWEGTDESVFRPALALSFESCQERADGFKLLGRPFFEEVAQWYPDMVSLLQLDEEDDWGLHFHDSGMLNLLLRPDDLIARNFGSELAYLHSA